MRECLGWPLTEQWVCVERGAPRTPFLADNSTNRLPVRAERLGVLPIRESQGSGCGSAKADVDRLVGVRDATAHRNVVTALGLFEHHARVLVGEHDLCGRRLQDSGRVPLGATHPAGRCVVSLAVSLHPPTQSSQFLKSRRAASSARRRARRRWANCGDASENGASLSTARWTAGNRREAERPHRPPRADRRVPRTRSWRRARISDGVCAQAHVRWAIRQGC